MRVGLEADGASAAGAELPERRVERLADCLKADIPGQAHDPGALLACQELAVAGVVPAVDAPEPGIVRQHLAALVRNKEDAPARRALPAEESVVVKRYRDAEAVVAILIGAVMIGPDRQAVSHEAIVPAGTDIPGRVYGSPAD
jgi:hypothetical protein